MKKNILFYLVMILITFSIATLITVILNIEFFIIGLGLGCLYLIIGFLSRTEDSTGMMREGGILMYEENIRYRNEKIKKGDYDFSNKKHGFGLANQLIFLGIIVIIMTFVINYIINSIS